MKILHLLNEPWDSGITAFAVKIASIQIKRGDSVLMGVLPGKKPEQLAHQAGIPTAILESFWDLKNLLNQNTFDLINTHNGRSHTWAVLCRILMNKKLRFTPIVRTRGDARKLRTSFLNRFVYKRTQGVIAASEHIRRQYEMGYGFDENQARTIYPSVEADNKISPLDFKKVGIIGRLDPVKGHSILLEAAALVLKEYPQVEFLVAGREANISYTVLKNQAVQLGIDRAIHFLGFQTSASDFMRKCGLGVIPSLGSEEVSRACLEWMGTGRPVVGTLVGCLPELIDPQDSGLLVPPGDSTSLSDAIIDVLKNPDRSRKWGENGRNVAAKRFGDDIFYEKTKRLYEWAIGSLNTKMKDQ